MCDDPRSRRPRAWKVPSHDPDEGTRFDESPPIDPDEGTRFDESPPINPDEGTRSGA